MPKIHSTRKNGRITKRVQSGSEQKQAGGEQNPAGSEQKQADGDIISDYSNALSVYRASCSNPPDMYVKVTKAISDIISTTQTNPYFKIKSLLYDYKYGSNDSVKSVHNGGLSLFSSNKQTSSTDSKCRIIQDALNNLIKLVYEKLVSDTTNETEQRKLIQYIIQDMILSNDKNDGFPLTIFNAISKECTSHPI